MIHILYGDDDFSISETLSSMKESVGAEELRDVNITTFTGSGVGFGELTSACSTVPFLAERRMVVVEGLLGLFESRPGSRRSGRGGKPGLGEWEALERYLPDMPESTELVLVDGRLLQSNPLLTSIRQPADVRTFPVPAGGALTQWTRDRAADHGTQIEPRAAQTLSENIGGNLRAIDNELEKLSLLRHGSVISDADVRDTVAYVREANIFAAVDAVIEGRPGPAIQMTQSLMDSGRTVPHLLAMLARQVRLLLLAKDLRAQGVAGNQVGGRLSLSGYPLRKTLDQESRFTFEQLAEVHGKLVEFDLTVKTLPIDERTAFETLIADLAMSASASPRG